MYSSISNLSVPVCDCTLGVYGTLFSRFHIDCYLCMKICIYRYILHISVYHFPLCKLTNTYHGILWEFQDHEGFYSEDKAFMKVQWKTTELPPLPEDRLMTRLCWEAQDAEDAWSLSSATSGHEGVKLVHILHAMTKSLSEYSFHTFTLNILNSSVALWVSRRHFVAGVLGASVEVLAEKSLQCCPCEERPGDAPCCTQAALRDPPGQDKTEPIRQARCAPGKTHLRMGKIWEKEDEGRWRSKLGEENRIRVIQQRQQEDEILHGGVDGSPWESQRKELNRNLHMQTTTCILHHFLSGWRHYWMQPIARQGGLVSEGKLRLGKECVLPKCSKVCVFLYLFPIPKSATKYLY